MPYPPRINDAVTFPAPPPGGIVGACIHNPITCSIASLTLQGHPSANTSFDAPPGAPLDSAAAGRYVIAPIVEPFPVAFTLTGHDRIEILRLELYRRGDAVPFWHKTLDYTVGGILAAGTTPFDGDLHNNVHLASVPPSNVAVGNALGLNFPRQTLTAEHAPYKLVLRIQQVQANTQVTCAARWIYLDVIVHDIQLHLGQAAWIPPAGPAYVDVRYRALTVATHAALDAQLAAHDLGAGAADANVPLAMNVFSKSTEDFYCNTIFVGQKLRWRDGPTLPLQATLRIRRSDGNPAAAQAGADALGNLSLLWDWECGNRPAHPNQMAQAFIADALGYKPADWPTAHNNCHVDRGGKRGAGGGPHFQALPGGALPAPADAIAPVVNRPWATSSQPIADSTNLDGGKAGVLFLPSRIAGDTYRLRVYLGYPNIAAFDVALAGQLQAAADESVRLESGATLIVRHKVDVAHQWRKNGGVDALSLQWAQVQAYLAAALVDLEAPPVIAENLVALDYQNAATAQFLNLDRALICALDVAANQPNGDHGVHFVDYNTFRTNVRNHGNALVLHFGAVPGFIDDGAFRGAQIAHLALALVRPNGYHLTDLILPTRADAARTQDERRDVLLRELGITSENTYKEKCKSWGDDILAGICGHHARAISPNETGIHLYHFDFVDQWHQHGAVAEASTTVSNHAACPACATATPTAIDRAANRICGNCGFRLDESAVITGFAPFRYMNGTIDAWANQNLTFGQRAKIRAGRYYGTTAAISIAHEIGHHLGMPHAGPNAHLGPVTIMRTGGVYPTFHEAADDACIMSYNFTEAPRLHFCGLCSLRLAGWSMGTSAMARPNDWMQDQATVPLGNRLGLNQALAPLGGAIWTAPDPQACQTCNQAFGIQRRAHHCRLCGNVFCSDHAQHQRPVRNPLKANTVTVERVCRSCEGYHQPIAPDPGALWEPDENSTSCSRDDCRVVFSAMNRKHHCRVCGKIYCAAHTNYERQVRDALSAAGPISIERVCDACDLRYA